MDKLPIIQKLDAQNTNNLISGKSNNGQKDIVYPRFAEMTNSYLPFKF